MQLKNEIRFKPMKAGKYVIFAKLAGFLNPGVLETVTCDPKRTKLR